MKKCLAVPIGLKQQAKYQLVTLQPDVQVASADAQLLTHPLLTHITMIHSNSLATKREAVLFSHFCLRQKLRNDPGGCPSRSESTYYRNKFRSPV